MNLGGKNLLACLVIVFLLFAAACVSVKLRTANSYYDDFAFADAIKNYEAVLAKKMIPEAAIKLADCYRQVNNPVKAEQWYNTIVKLPDAKPEHKYYYAEALMENGKYPEAKEWFGKYLQLIPGDDKAKKLMESCDSIVEYFTDTTQYNISLLSLNTTETNNFSPAFYRSGIVFVSDRSASGKNKAKSEYTGKEYLDLFYAKKTDKDNWLEPELLRGKINGLYNEGPAVFTKDYNTVYFTRNDYNGATARKNKKNFNLLKVFKGLFADGEWNEVINLPFNNDEYSVGHPALSGDGTKLYFVSDMPWGYGGTDIYSVQYINGRWSNPVNMGSKVNTAGNELFPFFQNDTTMYFSSDGNHGMGGLDVFQANFKSDQWETPFNLGYPVNSSKDDFGFIIDSAGTYGYFSSNRISGTDKIFSFKKNPPKLVFTGMVSDKTSSSPLGNVKLTLRTDNIPDTSYFTASDGKFVIPLRHEKNYKISISRNNYFTGTSSVSTLGQYRSKTFSDSFKLEKIITGKVYTDYSFAFEKGTAKFKQTSIAHLDSIVNWMKEHPGLKIEISNHTDSRGNDKDNLLLSQRRADAIADYLSLHGIKPRRVNCIGFGETRLLNGCVNGILCLEEDHRINLRTEIKITGVE